MGRNNPKVSVVIPTYNRKDVRDAVKSALGQTYDNLEVIVVDDCSEKPARERLSSLSDERLKIYRHEINKNGSAARNTGINKATGQYIAFLDDDDVWVPEKIQKQIQKLSSTSDEFKACHTGFKHIIDEKEKVLLPRKEGDIRKNLLLMEVHGSFGSSLIVDSDIVEKVGGFDESFERHQDWEFLVRILEHTKICVIKEPLVIKKNSSSRVIDPEKKRKAKKQYLSKFSELIDSYSLSESRKIYSKHYWSLSQNQAENKKYLNAIKYGFAGFYYWPFFVKKPVELLLRF